MRSTYEQTEKFYATVKWLPTTMTVAEKMRPIEEIADTSIDVVAIDVVAIVEGDTGSGT